MLTPKIREGSKPRLYLSIIVVLTNDISLQKQLVAIVNQFLLSCIPTSVWNKLCITSVKDDLMGRWYIHMLFGTFMVKERVSKDNLKYVVLFWHFKINILTGTSTKLLSNMHSSSAEFTSQRYFVLCMAWKVFPDRAGAITTFLAVYVFFWKQQLCFLHSLLFQIYMIWKKSVFLIFSPLSLQTSLYLIQKVT